MIMSFKCALLTPAWTSVSERILQACLLCLRAVANILFAPGVQYWGLLPYTGTVDPASASHKINFEPKPILGIPHAWYFAHQLC